MTLVILGLKRLLSSRAFLRDFNGIRAYGLLLFALRPLTVRHILHSWL
ncbi:hypothetical protein EG68_12287 [Paragonimus skrjabini miyazakii]|uniref:Uncharacterized protein n=1 Tax=Paragonimus skrjabini miyazakii TaxID=59628 RepID=A0A8S9YCT7_9TREM|nr:hypothetical protein EG68_12287 [Paragonimus skrjabini miyazakii]